MLDQGIVLSLCRRASEYPVAANRILAGHPPLFVRDRSQRDVSRSIKQAVVGLDAITRGEYVVIFDWRFPPT